MLIVVTPPDPVMTPSEVSASFSDGDTAIQALIAAATEEFDGPTGWLGRAIGAQTLELSGPSFCALQSADGSIRLRCLPIIRVTSVTVVGNDGEESVVSDSVYRLAGRDLVLTAGSSWPSTGTFPDAVRIRYEAGYNGDAVSDGGTGDVPARVKLAISTLVQASYAAGGADLMLKSESVDGVGDRQFFSSAAMQRLSAETADRILSGLRVFD